MPKMLILAVATSSALAGAAATYFLASRPVAAGNADRTTPWLDRARALSTKASDAMRSEKWRSLRGSRPVDGVFEAYRSEVLSRLERQNAKLHVDIGRLRLAKDRAEFDAILADHEPISGGTQGPVEGINSGPSVPS